MHESLRLRMGPCTHTGYTERALHQLHRTGPRIHGGYTGQVGPHTHTGYTGPCTHATYTGWGPLHQLRKTALRPL